MRFETYEQILIPAFLLEGEQYLKEGGEVLVSINQELGQPIRAELPEKIVLKIVKCNIKERSGLMKGVQDAMLEIGVVIQVPLSMHEGDCIRINTKLGEYIERVKQLL